tara:strand:+ start:5570 stop:6682 length:1113 start_codon:yes stop_codon:yes gene_type:complete
MRHLLITLFLFSAFLSFAQVEQKKEKERRVAPAMNNVLREEVTIDEVETVSKSKKSNSKKQLQIQTISATISATLSQASRMQTQRSFTDQQKQTIQNKVAELKAIDKHSFEFHLYDYLKTPYDFDNISSLKKAESMNAYDFTVLRLFAAYYHIQNDEAALKQYLSKLNQGKYFRTELDLYAALTLESLPKGAVLITHGNDDTYPLLIQQYIKNTRTDVEIISLDHLLSEVYRNKLKNKGYKMPDREIVDTRFLSMFVSANSNKKIVCANSIPKPYLTALKGDLNIVGFGYSTSLNENNTKFYESQLKFRLIKMINANQRDLMANSLPILFDVRNDYIDKNKIEKRVEVEKYLRLIGEKLGRSSQINALLK